MDSAAKSSEVAEAHQRAGRDACSTVERIETKATGVMWVNHGTGAVLKESDFTADQLGEIALELLRSEEGGER